jgi:hypothetical protein
MEYKVPTLIKNITIFVFAGLSIVQTAVALEIDKAGVQVSSPNQAIAEECGISQSSLNSKINETLRINGIEPSDIKTAPLFFVKIYAVSLSNDDCFGFIDLNVYDRAFGLSTSWSGEEMDSNLIELCAMNFYYYDPKSQNGLQRDLDEAAADITRQCLDTILNL